MNITNLKECINNNSSDEIPISHNDKLFLEFNENLENFIADIKSKNTFKGNISNKNNDKKHFNFIINNAIKEEITISNNNNYEDKYIKASNRMNFEKLLFSDQFAENYTLNGSNIINNDENYNLPYITLFDDIILNNESIFYILDNNYKNKFLNKEDIKGIKKEEIKLNFGKDPYEIYEQLLEGKIHPHDKISIEFYNSLNNFNIFTNKKIPIFSNINMDNNGDFNMIKNFFSDNIQESNKETLNNYSLNSTKQNKKNKNDLSIINKEKDFLLNDEKNMVKKLKEKDIKSNKKYIGKKKKNK